MSRKFTSTREESWQSLEPTLSRLLGDHRHEDLFDKQDFFQSFSVEGRLAPLSAAEDVTFSDLRVKGFLSSEWSPTECRAVLERYWDAIGQAGRLAVTLGFEERESKQSADGYEMLVVSLERGSPYVIYFANASKLAVDAAYAKQILGEMISSLELPMVLGDGGGFYSLEPRDGNDLRTSGGLLGRNPTGFTCEAPKLNSIDGLTGVLERFCERFEPSRIFEVNWSTSHSSLKDGAQPEHGLVVSLYNATVADLDAGRHEIHAAYKLQGAGGLDAVSTLCGEADEVATPCWNVFPGDVRVCISLVTTAGGHRIKLVSESQAALDAIREAMEL